LVLELTYSLLWKNSTSYKKFEITFLETSLLKIVQKPLGLLSLLDEESTFPNGTDLTFADKLKQHLKSNSCFRGERNKAFTVRHYAGEV
jgi:myosin-5